MTQPNIDLTAVAEPVAEPVDARLTTVDGIAERACEICGNPVNVDDRHEILRAGGPVWRHNSHTETV